MPFKTTPNPTDDLSVMSEILLQESSSWDRKRRDPSWRDEDARRRWYLGKSVVVIHKRASSSNEQTDPWRYGFIIAYDPRVELCCIATSYDDFDSDIWEGIAVDMPSCDIQRKRTLKPHVLSVKYKVAFLSIHLTKDDVALVSPRCLRLLEDPRFDYRDVYRTLRWRKHDDTDSNTYKYIDEHRTGMYVGRVNSRQPTGRPDHNIRARASRRTKENLGNPLFQFYDNQGAIGAPVVDEHTDVVGLWGWSYGNSKHIVLALVGKAWAERKATFWARVDVWVASCVRRVVLLEEELAED